MYASRKVKFQIKNTVFFQTRMKTKSTSSSRVQPEILTDAHVKKACGGSGGTAVLMLILAPDGEMW